MASYSSNLQTNINNVCQYDTNSENLYKISKEFVILFETNLNRKSNNNKKSVAMIDLLRMRLLPYYQKSIVYILVRMKDFSASRRSPRGYSRAKISLPNKEDTYYKTFAYWRLI